MINITSELNREREGREQDAGAFEVQMKQVRSCSLSQAHKEFCIENRASDFIIKVMREITLLKFRNIFINTIPVITFSGESGVDRCQEKTRK